jgi:hypothetical protein
VVPQITLERKMGCDPLINKIVRILFDKF